MPILEIFFPLWYQLRDYTLLHWAGKHPPASFFFCGNVSLSGVLLEKKPYREKFQTNLSFWRTQNQGVCGNEIRSTEKRESSAYSMIDAEKRCLGYCPLVTFRGFRPGESLTVVFLKQSVPVVLSECLLVTVCGAPNSLIAASLSRKRSDKGGESRRAERRVATMFDAARSLFLCWK